MNEQTRPTRKPYVAPRIVEQGKVAKVTRQVTPTPTPSGVTDAFLDEF